MPDTPDAYIIIHVWTSCDEHGVCVSKDSAEVIEIAWILLEGKTLNELHRENTLVRPVNTPITSLCTSSTGLTWDHVQNAGSFREAIQRLDAFVKENLISHNNTFTFVALDAWDLRVQVPREARDKAVALPPYLQHPKCHELRVEYARWQQYHPEALPFGPSSLGNICAALEVEAGLATSSSQTSLSTLYTAHSNYTVPRRAMETADIITKSMRALIKRSQPADLHPDVFTKPRDALADVHAFLREGSKVLHLSGLPHDTTQSELESWFTQHGGRPTAFWTLRTPDSHKPTGSGYAVFSSHEEAAESLGMNGRALGDKAIEVSPSSQRVLERAAEILTPFPPSKNRPRPGDWTCPSCGFSNFQRRTACFRCSFPATSNTGASQPDIPYQQWPQAPANLPSAAMLEARMNHPAPPPNAVSHRPTVPPGSVPFRAGDWKCGAEGCGYHNFAKNVTCLRCSASRNQAALIADSIGGLNTPGPMGSMGSLYSNPSHHGSDSLSSSIFTSSQFPPSQAYPQPLPASATHPSHSPSYTSLASHSFSGQSSMSSSVGGLGIGSPNSVASGTSTTAPQMESGDWTCQSCGFVNFRRRDRCLRCNLFNPTIATSSGLAASIGASQGHPGNMPIGTQSTVAMRAQQTPSLSVLDTSLVDPFSGDEGDTSQRARHPQSASAATPPTTFLTRNMGNLSLGPLTGNSYGGSTSGGAAGAAAYGTIGSGSLTASSTGGMNDEYDLGSRSASAVDRFGSASFFSARPGPSE